MVLVLLSFYNSRSNVSGGSLWYLYLPLFNVLPSNSLLCLLLLVMAIYAYLYLTISLLYLGLEMGRAGLGFVLHTTQPRGPGLARWCNLAQPVSPRVRARAPDGPLRQPQKLKYTRQNARFTIIRP
jgi:hypothetical protein